MSMNPLKILIRYKNVKMPHWLNVINHKGPSPLNIHCRYCSSVFNEKFVLNEDDDFYSKIIYNEIMYNVPVKKKQAKPIFLKYLSEEYCTKEKEVEKDTKEEPEIVSFPIQIKEEVLPEINTNTEEEENKENVCEYKWEAGKYPVDVKNFEKENRWNTENFMDNIMDDTMRFGTCDPSIPVSKIPCGGCGAFFQCNDASIPGFLPKEIFELQCKDKFRGEICQRCNFLKTYNVALGLHVSPAQYEQIISSLKSKTGLVIFMVDLLDFPCSIFPKIIDLIGSTKPIVVVGNKVDLLLQEDHNFLKSFKNSLLTSLRERQFDTNNIKHVALISAKTGYGIENLVSTLQEYWENQGDVYLVGCTNVGKSSLFNALIHSDYCKISASDILQRATVSPWPGTTLNLLKFPITKVLKWRLAARKVRLEGENLQRSAIERLQYLGETIKFQQIPLTDYVGRTFANPQSENSNEPGSSEVEKEKPGLNLRTPDFFFSKWFYDTPGVVHSDQILNLLTTPELLLTLPTKILAPRNFHLAPGHSIFIGGLARLDYISGPDFVWFTVFASKNLPITITKVEDGDLVYQKLLGTPLFVVPNAGKKRLSKWPNLASKKIELSGKNEGLQRSNTSYLDNEKEADADVVLTSAGWVSVNISPPYRCFLEAWTPEGRGIHVRSVPLIKKGHLFRGKRMGRTPAFECVVNEVKGYSIKDKPPF